MPPIRLHDREIWFITGSQHLYGEDALRIVEQHSREVVSTLDQSSEIPLRVVFKSVMTSAESIRDLVQEANASPNCAGLVAWMHTFSPARMWIIACIKRWAPGAGQPPPGSTHNRLRSRD